MCKPNYTVFTSLLACISSDTAAKRTMHFAKKLRNSHLFARSEQIKAAKIVKYSIMRKQYACKQITILQVFFKTKMSAWIWQQ